MTDIQKEIIEIIEPYMDKTLSEGCLIKWYSNDIYSIWEMYKLWQLVENYTEWELDMWFKKIYFHWYWEYKNINTCFIIEKIIWHYDITAVLKYIKNIRHIGLELDYYYKDMWAWKRAIRSKEAEHIVYWEAKIWTFPNKPLNLYTEEENKELLDLFDKLEWW